MLRLDASYIAVCLVLLAPLGRAGAAQPAALRVVAEDLLVDPDGTLGIEDVTTPTTASSFVPMPPRVRNSLPGPRVFWVRFTLEIDGQSDSSYVVSTEQMFARSLAVYLEPRPDALVEGRAGSNGRHLVAPLGPLPPGRTVLHARVDERWHDLLPVGISTLEEHAARDQSTTRRFGFLLGMLLVTALIAALVFTHLRERAFLWFVAWAAGTTLYFSVRGFLVGFFPDLSGRTVLAIQLIGLSGSTLALGGFTRTFLSLKRLAPSLDRPLLGYMGLSTLALVLAPVSLRISLAAVLALGALLPPATIIPGVVTLWRGFRPARFYLLGTALLGVSAALYALPPLSPEVGQEVFLVGSALNALGLALALADSVGRLLRERTEAQEATARREQMLKAIDRVGRRLFDAERWDDEITACLADLGRATSMSRVYLFENEPGDGGEVLTSQRAEWVAQAVEPQLDNPELQRLSLAAAGFTRWIVELGAGRSLSGLVNQFPTSERELLAGQGIRSLAVVPVFVHGRWWGFLGFDDCVSDRRWSTAELDLLHAAANLIEIAVGRALGIRELKASEEKYRTIFENAQIALFRVRPSDGKVLEANAVTAAILGFPDREAVKREYRFTEAWIEPGARERYYAQFNGRDTVDNYEALFRRRDGSATWVRFSAKLFSDRDVIEGVGIAIDEEKANRQALVESEARYRAVFETTGSANAIVDANGNFVLVNDELARLFGVARGDLERSRELADFVDGTQGKHVAEELQRSAREPRRLELPLHDANGRRLHGLVTLSPLPGSDDRLVSVLDMTERKRAEMEMYRAEKMASLGQIVAGVAHEINNPNNFVHFNLPILRRYVDALRPLVEDRLLTEPHLNLLGMPAPAFLEDFERLIETMQHGSQRISGIVADLKNYIRSYEEGMHPTSVEEVLERAMTLVGKQVRKMVKRFDVEVSTPLPKVIMNPGRIEQVIINLLLNAGQAADKSDSWVRLRARTVGDRVELAIADNGSGIAPDVAAHIFDPFFTTKGREAGTGLGLAIVQRVVSEHSGSIDFETCPGGGTTFTVTLPAAIGDPT